MPTATTTQTQSSEFVVVVAILKSNKRSFLGRWGGGDGGLATKKPLLLHWGSRKPCPPPPPSRGELAFKKLSSQSELAILLYQFEYIFVVLELEKTIKMTHISPTLTLNAGLHRNFIEFPVIHRSWGLKEQLGT
jgi:hypothetical protein